MLIIIYQYDKIQYDKNYKRRKIFRLFVLVGELFLCNFIKPIAL